VSSPHPIKLSSLPNPLTASTPRFSTRPVHPFSLSCEFDRQRGQFVVHAGARAGACAVVAAAVLALGAFGFVRSALFNGGPTSAAAAVTPPLASIATTTITPTKAPGTTPPSKKSQANSKATKSAKAETPAVSSASAQTIRHHTPAEQPKADQSKAEQAKAEQKAERRRAGLNYLVVLHLRTKASAEKAREALLRKGVATTVEPNLPGRPAQAKYSLVCITGFDPDSDRSKLDKQVKRLKSLKLDPKPYTWGG
jgi:hypothetical protein